MAKDELPETNRDIIHEAVAAELREQGYWQFEIVLGDDGGFEATWRTREGYNAVSALTKQPGEAAVERAVIAYNRVRNANGDQWTAMRAALQADTPDKEMGDG